MSDPTRGLGIHATGDFHTRSRVPLARLPLSRKRKLLAAEQWANQPSGSAALDTR